MFRAKNCTVTVTCLAGVFMLDMYRDCMIDMYFCAVFASAAGFPVCVTNVPSFIVHDQSSPTV